MSATHSGIVALAGGVGGAKLAHGLALTGLESRLAVVVNTADDFELMGLHISPDLDTVLYTLAGLANPETGWGIEGDTFNTLEAIKRYGGPSWFWLGDQDFATHILRTERLRAGQTISKVTAELASALDVTSAILPMCEEPVATIVATPEGRLDFQDYFVQRQHQSLVQSVEFEGIESASVPVAVADALSSADAIVLCPSNPIVSIGPILSVPGMCQQLHDAPAPVVAVSPIIGGQALKGPADRMLETLGHEVSSVGVAEIYRDFLTGIVIDEQDRDLAPRIEALGIRTLVTGTIMRSEADRRRLAVETLEFAGRLD
ncbi:MAG: 2-phospho-L-lactate transferase [Nitrolancea sp.]